MSNVDHPKHYNQGDIECIDAIKSSMTDEAFKGFCKGNCIKYLWRYEDKGEKEDLEKAKFYLERLHTTVHNGEVKEKLHELVNEEIPDEYIRDNRTVYDKLEDVLNKFKTKDYLIPWRQKALLLPTLEQVKFEFEVSLLAHDELGEFYSILVDEPWFINMDTTRLDDEFCYKIILEVDESARGFIHLMLDVMEQDYVNFRDD